MSAIFCKQCGVPILDDPNAKLCASCEFLEKHPDDLTNKTHLGNIPFKDMKNLDEDKRIEFMAGLIKKNPGKKMAIMVENNAAYQGKGDRYIEKLKKILPEVKIISRRDGPVSNVETIQVMI